MSRALLSALCGLLVATAVGAAPPNLKLLYLGDKGHHLPKARFDQLEPVMAKRGIALTYTDTLDSITLDNLNSTTGW